MLTKYLRKVETLFNCTLIEISVILLPEISRKVRNLKQKLSPPSPILFDIFYPNFCKAAHIRYCFVSGKNSFARRHHLNINQQEIQLIQVQEHIQVQLQVQVQKITTCSVRATSLEVGCALYTA